MVVAIMGLMMAMGVPAILRTMHEEPLRKAVNDVMNICNSARAQAIFSGVPATVVFHPRLGEMTLTASASTNADENFFPAKKPADETTKSATDASALNSTKFGDGVIIDMLDVSLTEYKDADEARVHFLPNGTSDEMTLVIHFGNEYRKITLEVTTALPSVSVIR